MTQHNASDQEKMGTVAQVRHLGCLKLLQCRDLQTSLLEDHMSCYATVGGQNVNTRSKIKECQNVNVV